MSREVLYYKASPDGNWEHMVPIYHTGPWWAFRIISISSWLFKIAMDWKLYIECHFTEESDAQEEPTGQSPDHSEEAAGGSAP